MNADELRRYRQIRLCLSNPAVASLPLAVCMIGIGAAARLIVVLMAPQAVAGPPQMNICNIGPLPPHDNEQSVDPLPHRSCTLLTAFFFREL